MVDLFLPYRPSCDGVYSPPLARFISPLPKGIVSDWLLENTDASDLVIDPLGANPFLALEAANYGRRVLFSRNNPVLWLLLEVLASAPSENEIKSSLSGLMLSRQSGITLEEQLKSIYASRCVECGEPLQPEGYIWQENANAPNSKIYHCLSCGDEGEKPVDQQDIENLKQIGNIGLQRTRAFQRAALGGAYEKESIEAALDCYLPRAVFTIMLLVNRLNALNLEKTQRRLLQAIFLSIFDDANSLWHWPIREHRHLQLNVPSRFFEKNLWLSISTVSNYWKNNLPKIPVTYYPNLPPKSGGVCLYQRRLADQDSFPGTNEIARICCLFPRPNQAFWTFSALWSGWLWGRKGATPMRSALARRRYDWFWFAQAIRATYYPISKKTRKDALVFGLLPDISPNFYLGMLCGMAAAGFQLRGAASRPEDELVQCEWQNRQMKSDISNINFHEMIRSFYQTRGEPGSFNEILVYCLSEIASKYHLSEDLNNYDETFFRQIQEQIGTLLRDDHFAISYRSNLPGGSRWWLLDCRDFPTPLSEQVEVWIRNELHKKMKVDKAVIEKAICRSFPGNQTPSHALIQVILDSYGEQIEGHKEKFHLKPGEETQKREKDLEEVRGILNHTAIRLGQTAKVDNNRIVWQDKKGKPAYQFVVKTTCEITDSLGENVSENTIENILVIPGSRSRLLFFRMNHDPHLASILENHWHILKFRHLTWLSARENLTLDLWRSLLDSDPIRWEPFDQTPLL